MSVAKLWRKIPEYYNLEGQQCTECSKLIFPPRDVCNSCGSLNLEKKRFDGRGKIITYTIIRTPTDDDMDIYCRITPYPLAIIELEQGPRLTAQIVDCGTDEVKINKKVELVFRKIMEKGKDGVIQYGYKFRLAQP